MSIKEYSSETTINCTSCQTKCGKDDRDFKKMKPVFIGTAVRSAEYNPGLGCIVKSDAHKSELMKRKDVVEVGNDYGSADNMNKHFEKRKEEEREKRWQDPDDFFL